MRSRSRFGVLMMVPVLLLGVGTPTVEASGADQVTVIVKASGDGTADTQGAFAVTASSRKLLSDVAGQLAPGTGTGRKIATTTAVAGDDGHFVADFSSAKMSGVVRGQILVPPPPPGTALQIEIRCTVSYPPLSIRCTIIISFTT